MVTSTEAVRRWRLANPEKWKAHQLKYRLKNIKPRKVAEDVNIRNKRYRDRAQLEFDNYKLLRGCTQCGYNKCLAALDFHHLDPATKERRVTARMWKSGLGFNEINKCILVCKNCHMEIHEEEKRKLNGDVYT